MNIIASEPMYKSTRKQNRGDRIRKRQLSRILRKIRQLNKSILDRHDWSHRTDSFR